MAKSVSLNQRSSRVLSLMYGSRLPESVQKLPAYSSTSSPSGGRTLCSESPETNSLCGVFTT